MAKKMTGRAQMQRNLQTFARLYPETLGRVTVEELEVEKAESQRRIPVDTGTAQDTAEVVGPVITPGRIEAAVAYGRDPTVMNPKGGAVSDYIIPLHEDLDAYHPNGEAKFLESVMNEAEPYLLPRIARRAGVDKVRL